MEFKRMEKGQRGVLPWSTVGGKEGLVPNIAAPSDGVRISLSTTESAVGVIFIPDNKLAEAGYIQKASNKKLSVFIKIFDRSELVEIASRLGIKASGTKRELALRILRKF